MVRAPIASVSSSAVQGKDGNQGAVASLEVGMIGQIDLLDARDRVAAPNALLEHGLKGEARLVAQLAAGAAIELERG